MPRKLLTTIGLTFLAAAAGPTLAQEVVYFTNGTTLAVEAHEFEEGRVRVKLGGQSEMAFPLDQVERIETVQGAVALPGSNPNRIVAGAVRGEVPPHLRRGSWEGPVPGGPADDRVGVDSKGVAVYRPFGADAAPNKRQFAVTGSRHLMNAPQARSASGGVVGTSRVGGNYVLPPKMPGGRTKMPVGLSAKPGTGGQGSAGGNSSGGGSASGSGGTEADGSGNE
jgi:hypothetical protein